MAETARNQRELLGASLSNDFDNILGGENQNEISINAAVGHLERNLNQGAILSSDQAVELQQKIQGLNGGNKEMALRVLNKLEYFKKAGTGESATTAEAAPAGADVVSIERGKLIGKAKELTEQIINVYDGIGDDLDSDNDITRNEAFDKLAGLFIKLKEFTSTPNNVALDAEKRAALSKIMKKLKEVQARSQEIKAVTDKKLTDQKTAEAVQKPGLIRGILNKIRNI